MEGFGIDNNMVKKICIDFCCVISDMQLECDQYLDTVRTRFKNNQKDSVTQDALNNLWYQFCRITHFYCALGVELKKHKLSVEIEKEIQDAFSSLKKCGGDVITLIDTLSKESGTSNKYISFVQFGKWFYFDDKSIDVNDLMLTSLDHLNKMMLSVKQYNGSDPKYLYRLMSEFEWGRSLVKNCFLPSTIYLKQINASRILLSAAKTTGSFASQYRFVENPSNLFAKIDMDINQLISKEYDSLNLMSSRKMPELSLEDF